MSFTQAEIDYLASRPLARLATVGPDGQPESWSWNMESQPADDEWYPPPRGVHGGT